MSIEAPSAAPPLQQKRVRSSPILWLLAAVLCGLLSSLGTQGLSDLADAIPPPDTAALQAKYVEPAQAARRSLDATPDPHQAAVSRAEQDWADDERIAATAEENFRTWLATRATLGGAGAEDAEIRARRDQLEKLRTARDDAAAALAQLRAQPDPREQDRLRLDLQVATSQKQYQAAYDAAHRVWQLEVLGLRLLLVIPVWLLAVLFWRRREGNRYVTLLWGYWAFSLWMLFWGVEPYLPHYGGYAPLSMGIGLTIWASVSLVRWFNARATLRRLRLVEKNIARHCCPSCERGYLVGRETGLDVGLARKASQRHFDRAALRPRACPFCGLRLFGACASCGNEQPVHLEHCAACQAPWREAA